MKLTEQQFIDGLTVDQIAFFNARLIEIRDQFQTSYAASITEVAAAKDQLLIDEKAAHAASVAEVSYAKDALLIAAQEALAATRLERDTAVQSVQPLQAEIARLTALIPPPLPPRTLYPRELLGRLTFAEVVAAIKTDDDAAIYAVANLQTTVAPVNLDSDETRTLIGALVVAKIITAERLAEILS